VAFKVVGPPEVEPIYTFTLAFTLDTPYPSRAAQASRAPVPSRANQASRVWTVWYRPEHPKRQESGRSAWFYL